MVKAYGDIKVKDLVSASNPKEAAEFEGWLQSFAEINNLKMNDLLEMPIMDYLKLAFDKMKEGLKEYEEFLIIEKIKPERLKQKEEK